MHKNLISRVVFWAALLVAIGCLGFAAWYHISNYRAAQKHEELVLEVTQTEATPAPTPAEQQTYTLEEIESAEFTGEIEGEAPVIPTEVITDAEGNPIDFAALQAYNSELYAWIRIPGTIIDYPVAQHAGTDQAYYLHHDLYGTPQFAGCIYSEAPSAKDFSDPVTVLYGHNMKNGSMFQNLHLFEDEDFFAEHPYIYIYTPDETYVYRIYSVYTYDDRPLSTSFDFNDSADLEEYLASTLHPREMTAHVRSDISVTAADKVLTLSTCISGNPSARLLVQAVQSYES